MSCMYGISIHEAWLELPVSTDAEAYIPCFKNPLVPIHPDLSKVRQYKALPLLSGAAD